MLASLNCPTCGAPAAGPDASRCDYCGSTLTSVACPSCFGAMFAGMQFCPHCGAKGDRIVDDGATLTCPGCRGDMTKVRVGATPMYECRQCAGNWLDADTFTRLCLDREERGAIASQVGSGGVELTAPKSGGVRYLPCPVCRRVMNRENFGRRSGIIMDVCKGHGVWFEHRELQTVMAFIDRGGLERSRALDAERSREEQRRERRDRDSVRDGVVIRVGDDPVVLFHSSSSSSATTSAESLLDQALRKLFS